MKQKQEEDVVVNKKYWIPHSNYTVHQDEVGTCAEENGGTDNCVPGMHCETCITCSYYKPN